MKLIFQAAVDRATDRIDCDPNHHFSHEQLKLINAIMWSEIEVAMQESAASIIDHAIMATRKV